MIRRVWRLLVVVVGLAASLASPSRAAEPWRWTFVEGDRYHVTLHQRTDSRTEDPDGARDHQFELTVDFTWRVERVLDDGAAELSHAWQRFRVRMTPHGGDAVAFDSADAQQTHPVARQQARQLRPLLKTRCRIVLTPRGRIRSVERTPGTP